MKPIKKHDTPQYHLIGFVTFIFNLSRYSDIRKNTIEKRYTKSLAFKQSMIYCRYAPMLKLSPFPAIANGKYCPKYREYVTFTKETIKTRKKVSPQHILLFLPKHERMYPIKTNVDTSKKLHNKGDTPILKKNSCAT